MQVVSPGCPYSLQSFTVCLALGQKTREEVKYVIPGELSHESLRTLSLCVYAS